MLPYDTVHDLTNRLLTIEADAHRRGWTRPPIVLVIVDRRDGEPGGSALQTITLPLQTRRTASRDTPLPDLLHGLAAVLHTRSVTGRRGTAIVGRILVCGVLYHDLHSSIDELCRSRRLEAVDTHGRRYRIVRREDQPYPTVHHGCAGDGGPVPATHPGLAEILAAANRILAAGSTT